MQQTITRTLTGIFVILLGIGALLDAVNVFDFWGLFVHLWPIIVIIGGILALFNDKRQYITSSALILAGTILLLNNLNIINVNIWSVLWPVIIIAIGLSILVNRSKTPRNIKTQDFENISAFFAGNDTINKSKDYKGGKASAIFGGITIDLRDAVIKDKATLDVFALCGGIELKVPREWNVKHSVFPVLGGVENKAHSDNPKAPTLYISGTVALGGVEVRS